ncbi:MAG: tetratricopeptide repeat protein [Micropepsaceae bacterium]
MQASFETAGEMLRAAAEAERSGEFARAAELLQHVCESPQSDANVLLLAGEAQMRLKRPRRAIETLSRAVALSPENAQLYLRRGQFLTQIGQHKPALANLTLAAQLEPKRFDVMLAYGAALSACNELPASLAAFQAARRLNPNHPGVLSNCGWLLCQLQRYDEAIAVLDRALDIAPGHAGARWNRSLCLLTAGRFEEGFADYEARMTIADPRYERLRKYDALLWRKGESIAGQRIFLYTDQGHGDTIQFIRLARDLMRMDAQVVIEVQEPLVELCKTLHPALQVITKNDTPPPFDVYCPLPSLPHRLNLTVDTIPARVPYLAADASLGDKWRERLASLNGRLKIGITWAGNPQHFNDQNRSIPLHRLLPVLESRNASFVSLQKEPRPGDADILNALGVFDATADLRSFSDTAALVSQLDMVISVDTSVAHLAGALAKPVWILLPFAVDFRWLAHRSDSPWYPTARLFRQPEFADWDGAIEQVRAKLAAL